jgi:hypothetical protein
MGSAFLHSAGTDFMLWEGNFGQGFTADQVHGTHHFVTLFRNRYLGWETGKTAQTVPVHLYTYSRYFNVIGNVLGQDSYHTRYESFPPDDSNCNRSVFALGWGGNCTDGGAPDDSFTRTSLMRWGNYDVVSRSVKFAASEVPSAIASFPNPVPAGTGLPASLYLPAKPSWWGNVPWPAIGPDVTGGPGPGGRAYDIPAKLCYDTTPRDGQGILSFSAARCYGGGTTVPPPAAPTNLVSVVR